MLINPLHNQRRREAERAGREAAGESFWTQEFPAEARVQLLYMMRATAGESAYNVTLTARGAILMDEGWERLVKGTNTEIADFERYLKTCPDNMMPTVIEAWSEAASEDVYSRYGSFVSRGSNANFTRGVNEIFERHRIAYELIDSRMVEKESRELHKEVVAPVLKLLARTDGSWAKVENSYRDALEEISRGSAANAITDAGTALQEALKAAGATGNALGPLITSARNKGLLAGHDTALGDSVAKAMEWVSSDRSQTGDAHHVSDAVNDDAWLTVHVAGALILRLSKSSERGA